MKFDFDETFNKRNKSNKIKVRKPHARPTKPYKSKLNITNRIKRNKIELDDDNNI